MSVTISSGWREQQWVTAEPIGTKDGINKTFLLPAPVYPDTEFVVYNEVILRKVHTVPSMADQYQVDGANLLLGAAPYPGDNLWMRFVLMS